MMTLKPIAGVVKGVVILLVLVFSPVAWATNCPVPVAEPDRETLAQMERAWAAFKLSSVLERRSERKRAIPAYIYDLQIDTINLLFYVDFYRDRVWIDRLAELYAWAFDQRTIVTHQAQAITNSTAYAIPEPLRIWTAKAEERITPRSENKLSSALFLYAASRLTRIIVESGTLDSQNLI